METPASAAADDYWRRLMHRWFVQYNPTYLLSGALVLGGVTMLSRGFAAQHSRLGSLGVSLIAEVYSFALILGAALLTRIHQRRPATMLLLLAMLYQGDVTLHNETASQWGTLWLVASVAWFVVFGLKLRMVAWAAHLRLSRSSWFIALFGAAGLAAIPHILASSTRHGATLITGWAFVLVAAALWTRRAVDSTRTLDAWAETVLARSRMATWALWLGVGALHVGLWVRDAPFSIPLLLPGLWLLATRWVRRESVVWSMVSVGLLAVGVVTPQSLALYALMCAGILVLHAMRRPAPDAASTPQHATGPYRSAAKPPPPPPVDLPDFAAAPLPARLRLLSGAAFALYLAVWTRTYSGGALPEHSLLLDALLVVACLWFIRARCFTLALPTLASATHFGFAAGWLGVPNTLIQWGALFVSAGFAALLLSLLTSFQLHRAAARQPPPD